MANAADEAHKQLLRFGQLAEMVRCSSSARFDPKQVAEINVMFDVYMCAQQQTAAICGFVLE